MRPIPVIARLRNVGLLVLLAWVAGSAAGSVEAQTPPRPPTNLFIGGVASIPEFVGSSDDRILPFPVMNVAIGGSRFEFGNLDGRLDLLGRSPLVRFGPVGTASLARTGFDAPGLGRLPDIDFGLEVGVHAGRSFPIRALSQGRLDLDIAVRRDILGAHDGTLVTPEIETIFSPARRIRLSLRTASTWASSNYMDTWFGVAPDTSGLFALSHVPGAGFRDVTLAGSALISIMPRWGLVLRWEEMFLVGGAADSPIFNEEGVPTQRTLGLGISYLFY